MNIFNELLPEKGGSQAVVSAALEAVVVKSETDNAESSGYVINTSVYDRLPNFLKDACRVFDDPHERDVFLTSAIGVISGCFPTVFGTYNGRRFHSNLFVIITAPPASGKGEMIWAKRLAQPLHEHIKSTTQKVEGNAADANQSDLVLGTLPKVLFIPANSSLASVTSLLSDNGGKGIIFETELASMVNAFKQDWGNFSEILLKSFQHESITASRKTNREYVEIEYPRLSMCMSGTPKQVVGIIPSAESGLFSRCLFYTYKTERSWHDVSPNGQKFDKEDFFKKLGNVLADYALSLQNSEIEFTLTKEQWSTLNVTFASLLAEADTFETDDIAGTVVRLGLNTFRIAMILSIIRHLEEDAVGRQIECGDNDFTNAIELSKAFYQHTRIVYNLLPKKDKPGLNASKRSFYEALPEQEKFSGGQAIVIGEGVNIKRRSVGNYLKEFTEKGFLTQPAYGWYCKN